MIRGWRFRNLFQLGNLMTVSRGESRFVSGSDFERQFQELVLGSDSSIRFRTPMWGIGFDLHVP